MKIKSFLFYLLALILGGCLPIMSLNPFGTEENVVFEEKLLGTWIDDSNNPETTWEFTRLPDEPNSYHMIFSDNEGKKGSFTAALIKIQNSLFLDIFPDEPNLNEDDPNQKEWLYNTIFLVPAHTILKVDLIEPHLKLKMTTDSNFEELIEPNPDIVKYISFENRTVLTSPTEEIQAFILKYANDEKLFSEEFNLIRKSEP